MTAIHALPQSHCPSDVLGIFDWVDATGTPDVVGEAELRLGDGRMMAVRGGGEGTKCSAIAPYGTFEVLLDHEAPRFWRKYSDDDDIGALYAYVPRLLVAHTIIRAGGIAEASCRELEQPSRVTIQMMVRVPANAQDYLRTLIEGVAGAALMRSRIVKEHPSST